VQSCTSGVAGPRTPAVVAGASTRGTSELSTQAALGRAATHRGSHEARDRRRPAVARAIADTGRMPSRPAAGNKGAGGGPMFGVPQQALAPPAGAGHQPDHRPADVPAGVRPAERDRSPSGGISRSTCAAPLRRPSPGAVP